MTPQQVQQNSAGMTMVPTTFLSHFAQMCGKARQRFENDIAFPFDGSWFFGPSDQYNPYMAWSAMAICLSGYKNVPSNGFRYIRKTFTNLECQDIDISSYYHLNDENPIGFVHNVNQVSYAFGHRPVTDTNGHESELIIMMLRGTSDTVEWLSNSEVADSIADGDYSGFDHHEGFWLSARKALDDLRTYVERHNLDLSSSKLWVIGHSRGAAVANVLAAMIDEDESLGVNHDDFYAYTFATSRGTMREDANSVTFNNIFNVNNVEDYIPRLPPAGWGIRRFGVDLYFPSVATRFADFASYHKKFLEGFSKWTHMDFPSFHGFAETNALERGLVDLCPDVATMYQQKRFSHGGTLTFAQYFSLFTDLAAIRGGKQDMQAALFTKYGSGVFSDFLSYFIHNEILGHNASGAHQEEGYLLKLQLCCEHGIDLEQSEPDTTCITVYGPVDLQVLSPDGQVVASIAKDKADMSLYSSDNALAVYVDKTTGEHSVWVPDQGDYTVTWTAREDARCTVLESKLSPMGDVISRTVYDVPFTRRQPINWFQVAAGTESEQTDLLNNIDVRVTVQGIGDPGEGKAFVSTYEQGAHVVPIPGPEVVCDARGIRNASYGDRVALKAHHGKHVRFLGWFEQGSQPGQGTPLSTDETFVLAPAGSCDLVAWFEYK